MHCRHVRGMTVREYGQADRVSALPSATCTWYSLVWMARQGALSALPRQANADATPCMLWAICAQATAAA